MKSETHTHTQNALRYYTIGEREEKRNRKAPVEMPTRRWWEQRIMRRQRANEKEREFTCANKKWSLMNSIYEFNARNVENENKQRKKMMAQRCANKFCGRRKLFAKRNLTISMHLFFRNLTPTTQKDSFDYIFIVTNHPKCKHIICIITRLIFCKLFCLVFFRLSTHTHTRENTWTITFVRFN